MIQALVYHAARGLNQFLAKNGISDTLSPLTIMTGRANPNYNELKLEFGSYVQVFEDNTPSNTTTSRNTGAIVLNPTGNAQGDCFFMSLVTGKRLSRHQWTEIPMTNAVISAVEAMAEMEGQPLIKGGVPLFEWRPNASVEDFLEEDVESADEYEHFSEDIFDPTEPDNDVVEEPNGYYDFEIDDDDVAVPDDDAVDDPAVFEPDPDVFGPVGLDPDANQDAESEEAPGDNAPNTAVEPNANKDSGTNRYNLRSDRSRSYGHRLDHQMDDPISSKSYESGVQMLQQAADKMDESLDDIYKYIFGHIMTQMTATAGIKKHGQAAVDALLQEFCQLDSKNVFEPLDASTLTASQKRESLRAVNLIKEKRSGKLKGRTCADGQSQRSKYTKEETTSPTVSTDALMISLMIDAKERRDVATADVEGAYLHADMEDFVLLKLVGEAVDIICQVNPKYEKFVVIENGKKVLYLQLLKPCTVVFNPRYCGTTCSQTRWSKWVSS
jgi:hypothetical protein